MTNPAAAIAQVAHGPSLAGIFMNIMLYGVMISQSFFYFSTYKRSVDILIDINAPHSELVSDPKWLKCYVALLLLADTLNSIFNMWWIYNVLINNFGDVAALENADWLFETEEALAGIIAMIVQMFFAWRILRLTRNYIAVAVIVAASLVGGRIGTAIAVAMRPAFAGFQHLKVIVILWLMGAAVCDVLITLALSWHLRQQRTGFSHTDTIISKIIQLTVSNGLVTAGFAVADIVAFLSTPRGIHVAFNYALVKLYGNSMMSSLNSRTLLSTSDKSYSGGKDPTISGRVSESGGLMSLRSPPANATTFSQNTDISGMITNHSRISTRPAQLVVNVETHELVDVSGPNAKSDPEWATDHYSGSGSERDIDMKDAHAL
ncbi:uncharacterized protein C8Q71DRAFT_856210 [Rhodofomes roseus]|uniref:DUF6534 domain-containing protein n=1 Tax=Rhodofomes roseus TaxID=34475 RepID=A0ABQ8KJD2_9APHY|nr:uncharacterized protein C8Q71DRAFT_856210 [Rhodofomes roseus]KAH9838247.1 hypothetical protein C8Q71DRAFT_856210 [Rhodofomes roseus]